MYKKILNLFSTIFIILIIFSFCGCTNNNEVEKINVIFEYDNGTTVVIDVNKGGLIKYEDIPEVQESTIDLEYDWYIDISKPINEVLIVKTLSYTKGLIFEKNGNYVTIMGLDIDKMEVKPSKLILPTYYQGSVVTVIGQVAFKSSNVGAPAENIVSVVLPDYLEKISYESFEFCRKLEAPKFPDTLTFVGSNAFNGCSFDTIDLPPNLSNIAERAFGGGNNSFTYVKIPSSVTKIESFSIVSSQLRKMVIPKSVVEICDGGIWPIAPIKSVKVGNFYIPTYPDFEIFYEGNIFDWQDLYQNISDVPVASLENAYEQYFHSSKDMVDGAIIYIYSENEPIYDENHLQNKYWKYEENGEIYIWEDPKNEI